MTNHSLFIANQWLGGEGDVFTSTCPVTGDIIWEGKQASIYQCQQAFLAAREAFTVWSKLPLAERIHYLQRYLDVLKEREEQLITLIAQEVGKPLWEAATEVGAMKNKLAISIDAYHARTGDKESHTNGLTSKLSHRPHGVMLVLGPYNFPGHLPNGHIIPALLAGNTVVFKPSEQTPGVAQFMVHMFEQAKLPTGVINLIQGDGQVGQALIQQQPDGVLFTGSYQTGKKIHAHFAGQPEVLLALEMGGNNPLIVGSIVDRDAAIFNTLMSAFITAGQRCTCARRLLVPATSTGDAFLEGLIKRTQRLNVGYYKETPEPFMGPVINRAAAQALLTMQTALISRGAQSLLPMQPRQGAVLTPGLIDISSIQSDLEDKELFGPLLQVIRYNDFEQAIAIANHTHYGLAAGLLSEDDQEQSYFYQSIKAGLVNINKPLTGAASSAPFGGIGYSGNHRPSAYYAADYCAYPVASMIAPKNELPTQLPLGMDW